MTEGDSHKRSVSTLKELARAIGAKVLENHSDERGDKGWLFPKMTTEKGEKQWKADVYISYHGRRVILESDGNKAGQGHFSVHNRNDDAFRDLTFGEQFGIPTVRYFTSWVKDLTPANLREDIEWAIKKLDGAVDYAIAT